MSSRLFIYQLTLLTRSPVSFHPIRRSPSPLKHRNSWTRTSVTMSSSSSSSSSAAAAAAAETPEAASEQESKNFSLHELGQALEEEDRKLDNSDNPGAVRPVDSEVLRQLALASAEPSPQE